MRPLQLKLKGINSYREEQVIDFETLTSQGLFGIFGPTGSGKSTILDAMTLALYAKLPRDTKNFINTNETTASVSFLFSITTDRTRKYLAERSFRYHNNTYTSTVRNTTGRLIVCDGENETVLADKPTEVTAECIRLLGLTSEDFMRTVVLPQGQFSEFLHLKNKERRIMLQRIFHLEKYGIELTSKIGRAKQKQELLLSKLDGEKKNFEEIPYYIPGGEEIKLLQFDGIDYSLPSYKMFFSVLIDNCRRFEDENKLVTEMMLQCINGESPRKVVYNHRHCFINGTASVKILGDALEKLEAVSYTHLTLPTTSRV